MNKVLLCFFITIICVNSSSPTLAQSGFSPKVYNVHTFDADQKIITAELKNLSNLQGQSHPEFGVLPFNASCKDCIELPEKRTQKTRYYVRNGSNGSNFYVQQYNIPLHFLADQEEWITVDPRLKPNPQNNNLLEAPNQFCPVSIDLISGECKIKSWDLDFSFNKNLSLGYVDQQGEMNEISVDESQANFTTGSEGVYFNNSFFGIDKRHIVERGEIETDFILNNKPAFINQAKWIVIVDQITLPSGYNLKEDEFSGFRNSAGFWQGALKVADETGQRFISIQSPRCYDQNGAIYEGAYEVLKNGNEFTVRIYLDADWFNSSLRNYPVIIDPIVSGENHIGDYSTAPFPGPNYANYGFSGPTAGQTCDYQLTVPVPGMSDLINCYLELEYETLFNANCGCDPQCGCKFYTIFQTIIGPCNSIILQCDTSPWQPVPYGTCTTDSNLVIGAQPIPYPSMINCVAPQCPDYALDFTLKNYQDFCPFAVNGNCGLDCASGHYWGITIQGVTLQGTGSVTDVNPIVCVGDSIELTGTANFGVPPYTWVWQPGNMNGQVVYDFPTSPGFQTYTVTITDACGVQVTDTAQTFITIQVAPIADAGPDIHICEGNSALIGGSPTAPPGSTIQWSSITPGGQSFLTSFTNANPTFSAPLGSSGTYQYAVEVTDGCSGWDTMSVTIHPNPQPFIVPPGPITFCEGGQVVLDAGAGYVTYNWGSNWGLTGETNQTIVVTQSGFYTCMVTDQWGCQGITPPVQVIVLPTPVLTIDASPNITINEGDSVTLNVTSDVISPNPFVWVVDSTLSCDTCQNPVASPLVQTTYYVSLYLDSCVGYASVTISVIIPDPFQIPNAFTPNSDGLNDGFYILFHQQGLEVKEFKVFNRWGEKVHDNPYQPWDGNYQGKPQPIGVFVYYVIVSFPDGNEGLAKGNVTLIR